MYIPKEKSSILDRVFKKRKKFQKTKFNYKLENKDNKCFKHKLEGKNWKMNLTFNNRQNFINLK